MVITQEDLTWIQISHLSHFQTKLSHPSVFLFNEYFDFFPFAVHQVHQQLYKQKPMYKFQAKTRESK